jgi:hypothetical protein
MTHKTERSKPPRKPHIRKLIRPKPLEVTEDGIVELPPTRLFRPFTADDVAGEEGLVSEALADLAQDHAQECTGDQVDLDILLSELEVIAPNIPPKIANKLARLVEALLLQRPRTREQIRYVVVTEQMTADPSLPVTEACARASELWHKVGGPGGRGVKSMEADYYAGKKQYTSHQNQMLIHTVHMDRIEKWAIETATSVRKRGREVPKE